MQTFAITVAPLPAAFLQRVREQGIDDLGQPVRRVIAKGGEPCRDALRRALPGEELILASFTPFSKPGPFHEYGPVYVFASGESTRREQWQPGYFNEQFVIRAYSADEEIVDAALVTRDSAADAIERFFARPDTAFLHARFPTYGCFACRIDSGVSRSAVA